jgi:hypothetical protein
MFDREQAAEIRGLCYEELKLIHRARMAAGSYRYLCLVDGRAMYCHTPFGEIVRDFYYEPNV